MKIFKKLRSLRAIQSRYLPYLETLEDVDIVRATGFFQDTGHPVSLKVPSLKNCRHACDHLAPAAKIAAAGHGPAKALEV